MPAEQDTRAGELEAPSYSTLGYWRAVFLDPGTLNHSLRGSPSLARPFRFYGSAAALGLGIADILGEANTGGLYVFGGGIFSKVAGIGEWLAFAALVPVLAVGLSVAFRSLDLQWRDHFVFALHVGCVVGVATAIETLLVWWSAGTAMTPAAQLMMLVLAAVYYVLALGDTYGRSLINGLRGALAASFVVGLWAALAGVLWTLTDFSL